MQKTLDRVGSSLGLIIDQDTLDRLGIDENTVLDISTDGETLVIRPVRERRSERVRSAAVAVADAHAEAFEKLAR